MIFSDSMRSGSELNRMTNFRYRCSSTGPSIRVVGTSHVNRDPGTMQLIEAEALPCLGEDDFIWLDTGEVRGHTSWSRFNLGLGENRWIVEIL